MNLFPPGVISPERTVGLRPEHIALRPIAVDADAAVVARVDFIEPLGSETLVHVLTDKLNFRATVRVPGFAAYVPGERLSLVPDMSRAVEF